MYIEEITEQTVIPNLMDDENVCMIKRNYSGKLEISELSTFQISKIKKYKKGNGHFTHGKTPNRPLEKAFKATNGAIQNRANEIFGELK